MNMGRYNDSLQSYEKAIDLNPNYSEAITGKEKSLEALGREAGK